MKVDATELDQPLVMHLRIEVPQFAKPVAGGLLGPSALRAEPRAARVAAGPPHADPPARGVARGGPRPVDFPDSFKMPAGVAHGEPRDGDALVAVHDAVDGHSIDFDRVIDMAAGRVQPGDEYAAWQKFVREADSLLSREVTLGR